MNSALVDLKQAESSLRQWMSPNEFKRLSEKYRKQVPSGKLFKQPGHQFLFEAWTACQFINLIPCEAVRLFDGNWPDFQSRKAGIIQGYEIAEVLEPGRKRGDENWNHESSVPDPVEDWYKRAALIPSALRDVVAKKVAKRYSPNEAALLLYLNIHEWGILQKEIETDFHAATQLAKNTFTDIWVLWKEQLYHLWRDGEKSTKVFQKQLSLADF